MKSILPLLIIFCCLLFSCKEQTKSTQKEKIITISSNKTETKLQLSVRGIDFSHFQNNEIDSINKDESGLSFIIFKATEGVTYLDPKFYQNWKTAQKKSFIKGAYHFYICEDDPVAQAQHYLNSISDIQSTDIPPIVDFEEEGIGKIQSIEEIQSSLKKFLIEIEKKLNRKPIIYTDINTGNNYLNDYFFADYPLWIASYNRKKSPDLPKAWENEKWFFWQKSDSYTLDSELDDFDKFNGSFLELKEFIKNSHIHK